MYWYWWAWIAIVFFLVLVPLGWGWGYRGWGPPYPRSYQRRRQDEGTAPTGPRAPSRQPPSGPAPARRVVVVEQEPAIDRVARGWGVVADLFWLAVLGAVIWLVVAWAA